MMKHAVKTRRESDALHLILQDVVNIVTTRLGPQASFNFTKLRKEIAKQRGTSVNHSSVFNGAQRKCVKIPRDIIDKDVIAAIDKGIIIKFNNV